MILMIPQLAQLAMLKQIVRLYPRRVKRIPSPSPGQKVKQHPANLKRTASEISREFALTVKFDGNSAWNSF